MQYTSRVSTFARIAPLPILAALAFGAHAQVKVDGQWHGGVSIGGSAAAGNTRSTALTLNVDATRATTADKISLYSLANYSSSKDKNNVKTKSAELFRIGGRYDYNLNLSVFVFGGGEAETNKPAGIKSKYDVNGGVGLHLVDTSDTTFDVFGGIGYADTDFTDGTRRNGVQLLLGEESSHKLTETSSFKQKLVLYPGVSKLGNRATFDAGLATSISGAWTLNTGVAVRYASKVAPGLKSTDTLLTVGFGYKY